MRIVHMVLVSLGALGCTGSLSGGTDAAEWSLVADEDGGLVDPRHPEFGSYPNPRAISEMSVALRNTGEVCAQAGTREWCGGAVQGIPYSTSGFIRNGRLCLRVIDLYGNDVAERCGIQPTGYTGGTRCLEARTGDRSPCRICTDSEGDVTVNTCNTTVAPDEFEDAPADCADPATAANLGIELFAQAFNAGLARIGLDLRIESTGAPSSVTDLAEDEVSISDGCAGVLEELADERAPGDDGYVFGPEAIDECLTDRECRIGQLVIRSMGEACTAIPAGCDTRTVEMAVVGAGGEAVETVCDDGGMQYRLLGDGSLIGSCVGSPLVVDLDADGLSLRGPRPGSGFALMGAGAMSTGWVTGNGDALLARDIDGDGRIRSGRELFGEATHGWAPDGFTALARHDANADGVIDRNDPVFESLLLWRDDGNAVSEPGELVPLHGTDIHSIGLHPTEADETDPAGNVIGLSSEATAAGGRTVPVHDVWFRIGAD